MKRAEFFVALHHRTPSMDQKVLNWAWSEGLFDSVSELEKVRIQKINWFAGYLFPKEEEGRLEKIMQFFLGLFLLDDLMDHVPHQEMIQFVLALTKSRVESNNKRIRSLGQNLLIGQSHFENEFQNQSRKKNWKESWQNYLTGLLWELENKLNSRAPSLTEYRLLRPFSSGVFLAIFFLRKDGFPDSCDAELLECYIARFICLANDLASFEKEMGIGDRHNEILILMDLSSEESFTWIQKEFQSLKKQIHQLSIEIAKKSEACRQWVEDLHLLLGGCLFWSGETLRYSSSGNGNQKTD